MSPLLFFFSFSLITALSHSYVFRPPTAILPLRLNWIVLNCVCLNLSVKVIWGERVDFCRTLKIILKKEQEMGCNSLTGASCLRLDAGICGCFNNSSSRCVPYLTRQTWRAGNRGDYDRARACWASMGAACWQFPAQERRANTTNPALTLMTD